MTRTRERGWARPVAVPTSLSVLAGPAGGRVTLPVSVYSSGLGTMRVFDLDDEVQRIGVYEVVLAEGTVADQRRFLNAEHLREVWPRLWLSPTVRAAWTDLFERPTTADGAQDSRPAARLNVPSTGGSDGS